MTIASPPRQSITRQHQQNKTNQTRQGKILIGIATVIYLAGVGLGYAVTSANMRFDFGSISSILDFDALILAFPHLAPVFLLLFAVIALIMAGGIRLVFSDRQSNSVALSTKNKVYYDEYTKYDEGVKKLLSEFPPLHPDYDKILNHTRQLHEAIDSARTYLTELSERGFRAIVQINRLCLSTLGNSFDSLCELSQAVRIKIELRQTIRVLNNEHVMYYLRWKYHHEPIFERNNILYPLAVYPAPPQQRENIESVLLHPLEMDIPEESLVSDSEMRLLIAQQANRPLNNLLTYTMRELVYEEGTTLGLRCAMGSYFDMIDTCDDLEWEISKPEHHLNSSSTRALRSFDMQQTLRKQVHALVENPVRDGAHRSLAISLSCLIAFRYQGRWWLMLRKRSNDVAVHANLIHVIPSFMFQPATLVHHQEFSIKHQIFREYLEELFNNPEPVEETTDPFYFYNDTRLQYLQDLMGRGIARLYFTGVAMNLLSLRPEICTVLRIDTDEWIDHHYYNPPTPHDKFKLNNEFFHGGFKKLAEDDGVPAIHDVPLERTDEAILAQFKVSPRQMVPCGAAAFWLAVDLLRELDKEV